MRSIVHLWILPLQQILRILHREFAFDGCGCVVTLLVRWTGKVDSVSLIGHASVVVIAEDAMLLALNTLTSIMRFDRIARSVVTASGDEVCPTTWTRKC